MDVEKKDYGGEPFINGQAVPYDPKYHERWVRFSSQFNCFEYKADNEAEAGPIVLGEPFINGHAVPYDFKYHEERVRFNAQYDSSDYETDDETDYETDYENYDLETDDEYYDDRLGEPFINGQVVPYDCDKNKLK